MSLLEASTSEDEFFLVSPTCVKIKIDELHYVEIHFTGKKRSEVTKENLRKDRRLGLVEN